MSRNRRGRRPRRHHVPEGWKYCPRCSVVKLLREFRLDETRNDGRSGWCKRCSANQQMRLRQQLALHFSDVANGRDGEE